MPDTELTVITIDKQDGAGLYCYGPYERWEAVKVHVDLKRIYPKAAVVIHALVEWDGK